MATGNPTGNVLSPVQDFLGRKGRRQKGKVVITIKQQQADGTILEINPDFLGASVDVQPKKSPRTIYKT